MMEVNGFLAAAGELKAPLTVIRQLAYGLDSHAPEKSEVLKSQLISVSDRAIKQVNDLMKIARLEDGLFEMEPVSVRAVCDDVARELCDLYKDKSIHLSFKNRHPLAYANHDMLHSIVYNFCSNAIHYSEDGLTASLLVRDRGQTIEINVRDYGPSLPVGIWRKFSYGQLENPATIAMRPGSSSLGLYIASKFSKYMNAEVSATRHRDGTTFRLLLPVSYQTSLFDFPTNHTSHTVSRRVSAS